MIDSREYFRFFVLLKHPEVTKSKGVLSLDFFVKFENDDTPPYFE